MNGYERIQAAFSGQLADKVPIMLHNFLMAAREAGYTVAEYRNDPRKIADSFIKAVETYRYDGVMVEIDTVTLAGAVGVPVDFPENEAARSHEPALERLEDIDSLPQADITSYPYVANWLEATRLLKEHFGDDVCIRGNCDQAPFSLASMIRTPSQWMMDIIDPDKQEPVFQLLEYCTDVTARFVRAMAETGAHMVSNGDSPAGPSMISPEMYRTYALPYEDKIADTAHDEGLPYVQHICGNTDAILEDMCESRADGFELDYLTNVEEVHRLFSATKVFIGNIDPSGVLAQGTPAEVREATRALLDIYGHTPRFVLNAGCALPGKTPSENLEEMIKTAREYR